MNRYFLLLLMVWWAGLYPVRAVILFGTGDASAHTTPPGGGLAGSGWDWQVSTNGRGTLVGPSHVLTAAHLGYGPNNTLNWGGLTFRVLESADPPQSDLRLLRIGGRFARWAPTYSGTNEVGNAVVFHGRGGPRGGPVTVVEGGQTKLCGWNWLATDGALRWGTNVIESILEDSPDSPGAFLSAVFDGDAGDDEATVSVGDSGGGVFLQEPDGWKLAGIMSSVEGSFQRPPESPVLYAALFDRRPFLEELSPGVWDFDPDRLARPGTLWLASRVSTYRDWLEAQIAQPPATPLPRLLFAASLLGPFQEFPTYAIEPSLRQITLLRTGFEKLFFLLEGEPAVRLVAIADEVVTLAY